MKHLYYIRHGLSEMNKAGLFAGSTDTPLTEEGRIAALAAGKKSKALSIDTIVASPLSRALDTAQLFAEGAELPPEIILTNKLLVERDFGILENTVWAAGISRRLLDDNLPEGVEPWSVLVGRAQKLLEELNDLPSEHVLLVGHGGIGRALRSVVLPDTDVNEMIPNTELIRLI